MSMGKVGAPPLAELISLKGRSSLITGSASGMGRAIALRFAEAGSNFILVDIDEEKLEATRCEAESLGARVETYRVDLSERSEVDELWSKLKGREPDTLVKTLEYTHLRASLR